MGKRYYLVTLSSIFILNKVATFYAHFYARMEVLNFKRRIFMLKKLKPTILIKTIKDEVKAVAHQLKYDLTHKKFKPAKVLAHRPRRH